MAVLDEYRNKLIDLARKEGDIDLALVACGNKSAFDYLMDLLKRTDIGHASVSRLTDYRLSTIIKANASRRNKILGWIAREEKEIEKGEGGNEFYLDLYQKELEILDTYALGAIIDVITNGEELTQTAYNDIADRAYRKIQSDKKKAAKEAAESAE